MYRVGSRLDKIVFYSIINPISIIIKMYYNKKKNNEIGDLRTGN